MTPQDRDYEDLLRRALHAAAESIQPADDGLSRIRQRLHEPRSGSSVLSGAAGWLQLLAVRLSVRLEPVTGAGRSALGQARRTLTHQGQRKHSRARPSRGWLGPAAGWFRPLLAVSAVAGIALVAFVVLHQVSHQVIAPANSISSNGSAGNGPGGTNGSASTGVALPHDPASSGASGLASTAASPSCSASPSAMASPAASTGASPSASPSDTATVTPSPTDSATDTPSPSYSGGLLGTWPPWRYGAHTLTTSVTAFGQSGQSAASGKAPRCGSGTASPSAKPTGNAAASSSPSA